MEGSSLSDIIGSASVEGNNGSAVEVHGSRAVREKTDRPKKVVSWSWT